MADVPSMNMPSVPPDMSPGALHKWASDMVNWHGQITINGLQPPFMSTDQLNTLEATNDLTQAGKIFFDSDTGKFKCTEVSGGNLVVKTITTS